MARDATSRPTISRIRTPGSVREPEQLVQADGQSWPARHSADRREHTWHERRAVQRVVPDRQGLASTAEDDLLVRDQPWQPYRVHVDPVDVGPASAVRLLGGGVRYRPEVQF